MNGCIITGINIDKSTYPNIARVIDNVSIKKVNKSIILATFFDETSNIDFRHYVLKNINTLLDDNKSKIINYLNIKDINDLNVTHLTNDVLDLIYENQLKSLISGYYNEEIKDGSETVRKNINEAYYGFSSVTASQVAKNYTARLILIAYNQNERENKTISEGDLQRLVRRTINGKFLTSFEEFIKEYITDEKADNLNVFKDHYDHYNESIAYFNNKENKFSDRTNRFNQLVLDTIQFIEENCDKDSQLKIRNFANLASIINGDGETVKKWYKEVFKGQKLFTINKNDILDDEEEAFAGDDLTDDNISNESEDYDKSIDQTTKSWSDKVLSNYLGYIATDVKLYLSNITKAKGVSNEKIIPDTDNELGVVEVLDVKDVINQFYNGAISFDSVDKFIESIKRYAETVTEYSGMYDIYLKCKNDRQFANRLYSTLFLNPTFKEQTIIENGEINNLISNTKSTSYSSLFYSLGNDLISGYDIHYSLGDIQLINNIITFIKGLKETDKVYNFLIKKNKLETESKFNTLYDIITKWFPTINEKYIERYINSSYGTKENVINLLSSFLNIIDETNELKAEKEKINIRLKLIHDHIKNENLRVEATGESFSVKNVVNAINKNENIVDNKGKKLKFITKDINGNDIPDINEYNAFIERPYKDFDYRKTFSINLIKFAKEFDKVMPANIQLNSFNGEGNLSSDILMQNKINNFIRQINYEDETSATKGLELLRDAIDNCPMYANSPLFYGLYNQDGSIVPGKEGLFTKVAGSPSIINPNAKNIIRHSLFDGIRNRDSKTGALYDTMSNSDLFISIINSFTTPSKLYDGSENSEFERNFADYITRIPSDSPRIYKLRFYKYDTSKLFIKDKVNTNNEIFRALYQLVEGEFSDFVEQLYNVTYENKDAKGFTLKDSLNHLITTYHYNKNSLLDDNGELSGNAFKFTSLPITEEGYDINEEIGKVLSLYGQSNASVLKKDSKYGLVFIPDNAKSFIDTESKSARLTTPIKEKLNEIISNWVVSFVKEIDNRSKEFESVIEDRYSESTIISAMLNFVVASNQMDLFLEGNSKFYKDARTFLKRAKEYLAGGTAYASQSTSDLLSGEIVNTNNNILRDLLGEDYNQNKHPEIFENNGWKAITISNVERETFSRDLIRNEIIRVLTPTIGEERAIKRANDIASKYDKIIADDGQSYITLEEFIKRKYADGTLYKYKELIKKLYSIKPDANGNYNTKDLDLAELDGVIHLQKNYYFDIYMDNAINKQRAVPRPRQIKNSEFVLIPQLLDANSDLRKLYDFMSSNGIGQVNTIEASKASNVKTVSFWNKDGSLNENFKEEFKRNNNTENFYYRYLYKQQDVPLHMIDKQNRASTQTLKKIFDNIDLKDERIRKIFDEFMSAFCANISQDKNKFIRDCGWKYDENGNLVNIRKEDEELPLDFTRFYEQGYREAQRLGMDSNFMDYFTLDTEGNPIMPNYMNNVSKKFEAIAQSLFNNNIAKQKLFGYHAAQVSDVGYKRPNGERLKYHEEVVNGKLVRHIEVAVPRWSDKIPTTIKYFDEKDGIVKEREFTAQDLPLDLRRQELHYMPTEGKQSITIIEVVEFLPENYGSTIAAPADFIAQTGKDFDIDSVYVFAKEMTVKKDELGNELPVAIEFDEGTEEKDVKRRWKHYIENNSLKYDKYALDVIKQLRKEKKELNENKEANSNKIKELNKKINQEYSDLAVVNELYTYEEFKKLNIYEQNSKGARNNKIVDCLLQILDDDSSVEENFSSSNSDDIKRVNAELSAKIEKKNYSPYNLFDQLEFANDAISGRNLKAMSVNRDSFNSICNIGKAILNEKNVVEILYDAKKYNIDELEERFGEENVELINDKYIKVKHNKWGWSNDNRNVDGSLITVYSSETTAQILDAMKEGTIFNENEYTFGVFKTLVDLGSNYENALSLLFSNGVSIIVKNNQNKNSILNKGTDNIFYNSIKDVASNLGIKINNKEISKYSPIKDVKNALLNYELNGVTLEDRIKELFNIEGEVKDLFEYNIPINSNLFIERLDNKEETEEEKFDAAAIDLATIIIFNNIKSTSTKVENVARCTRPDRFGASQTIYETKNILNDIARYSDEKSSVGSSILVNGKPLLAELYSDESFYPYVKSFLDNVTQLSVDINTMLFPLEGSAYNEIYTSLDTAIGKRINKENHIKFKQYIISAIYNQIDLLTKPLMLDGAGFIIEDIERYKDDTSNLTAEEIELQRIYGLNTSRDISFKPKSFFPKNDEDKADYIDCLNKYLLLSPVEKLNWCKINYKGNSLIAKYLEGIKFSGRDLKINGYSVNKISYNDSINTNDVLIDEFNNTFNNKDLFLKLLAIDLIKYAFLVEGFRFRANGITKIIGNNSILNTHLNGNSDNIIDILNQKVNNPDKLPLEDIIRNFVRSNSEICKSIELRNKVEIDSKGKFKKSPEENTKLFRECIDKKSGIIVIRGVENENGTNKYSPLIEQIQVNGLIPRFIRVIDKTSKIHKETLYEIRDVRNADEEGSIYMFPLNLLEPNEYRRISINPANTKYNTVLEYKKAITALENEEFDSKNGLGKDTIKKLIEQGLIEKYVPVKYNIAPEIEVNVDYLENERVNSVNERKRLIIDTFLKKINALINETNLLGCNAVYLNDPNIEYMFEFGKPVTQKIRKNKGEYVLVNITQGKFSKKLLTYLYHHKNEGISKVLKSSEIPQGEIGALNAMIDNDGLKYNSEGKVKRNRAFYQISYKKIKTEVEKEDTEEAEMLAYNSSTTSIGHTEEIHFIDENNSSYTDGIWDGVTLFGRTVVTDIERKSREKYIEESRDFISYTSKFGLDPNKLSSIKEHRKAVFSAAAKYYAAVANKLEDNITKYITHEGEFNIDDPELYKYLCQDEHKDEISDIAAVLLDALTFGRNISGIFNIEYLDEDTDVQHSLNSIKNSISKFNINNPSGYYNKIRKGFENMFNIYYANLYSTDPLVKLGIVKLTDCFGDINKFDSLFSDTAEIDVPLVQVMTKYILSKTNAIERIDAPEARKEFLDKWEKIVSDKTSEKQILDKIIKDGKLISEFNDNFITDYNTLRDAVENAKLKGLNTKDYIRAKLEFDKFKANYMHQYLKPDYYKKETTAREEVIRDAEELYLQYTDLTRQMYNKDLINPDSKEEKNRIQDIINKRKALLSDYEYVHTENGYRKQLKDSDMYKQVTALKKYIKTKSELDEEYFENDKQYTEEFNKFKDKYQSVIDKYNKLHSTQTLKDKLEDADYAEAYYWLAANSRRNIAKDASEEIFKNFGILKNNRNNDYIPLFKVLSRFGNRNDEFGIIDGTKFTDEEIEQIRQEILDNYNFNSQFADYDAGIMKDVEKTTKVYKDEFYELFRGKEPNEAAKIAKAKAYKEINDILINGFDSDGHLSAKVLFEHYKDNKKELERLGELFRDVRAIGSTTGMTKKEVEELQDEVEFKTNDIEFNKNLAYYKSLKGNENAFYKKVFKLIFFEYEFDEDGYYAPKLNQANSLIYGYAVPKDETKYLDEEKTKAKEFILKNVVFVNTEYYNQALQESIDNGTFDEWYHKNHIRNPYTGNFEPLPIWRIMDVNPTGDLKDSYEWKAIGPEYVHKVAKEDKLNDKYFKTENNYIAGNSKYDNSVKLTDKERELLNLIKETLNDYAVNERNERFINNNNLPRRYKENDSKTKIAKSIIALLGVTYTDIKSEYYDKLDYAIDKTNNIDMLQTLKTRGFEKVIKIEVQKPNESDEDYKRRVEETKAKNAQIIENNRKLEQAKLDNDWKDVIAEFVYKATVAEGKEKLKPQAYSLLEYLKLPNTSYKIKNGRLVRDEHSAMDYTEYDKIAQDRLAELYENWMRRLFYNQYHENNKLRPVANTLQNLASTKYMAANWKGGIANVMTGRVNIEGEIAASLFFDRGSWMRAINRYRKGIPSYVGNFFEEGTINNNKELAIISLFNVVDYDAFAQRTYTDRLTNATNKARELEYAFQSSGEHFMQNSVLFALLETTKIGYDAITGRRCLLNFEQYLNNIEIKSLEEFAESKGRKMNYNMTLANIKNDPIKQKKYHDEGLGAFVREYLNTFTNQEKLEFIKLRDKNSKNAREEFNKLESIEDQLLFNNKTGIITIKDKTKFTEQMFGEFVNRVISTNKEIHGVYDKLGAARIENKWYGSMIMQYKKHIYPGILKRYAGILGLKAGYNENRAGRRYGSYTQAVKLIVDIAKYNYHKEINNGTVDKEEVNVVKGICNVILGLFNIEAYKLNWGMLTNTEKANVRRVYGDLIGVAASVLVAALILGLTDDDDLKEDSFKGNFLSSMLNVMDREFNEANMFTPIGLVTEVKQMYDSPIAALKFPSFILNSAGILIQYCFDENFSMYNRQGENKIYARLVQEVPLYRQINNFKNSHIKRNYYKTGDRDINMKIAKSIANFTFAK